MEIRFWLALALVLGSCSAGDDGGPTEATMSGASGQAGAGAGGSGGNDPDGRHPGPCSRQADTGANGSIDFRETYTYDAQGNPLVSEVDRDADGTADWRTT